MTQRDADIRAFLKAEKWCEDKAARLISPASAEYILALGCFLQPVEHNIYRAFELAAGYPVVMKGYTQGARARVISEHWCSFEDPIAIGLDASKFDQHVSLEALQFEHSFYDAIYQGNVELRRLLNMQLRREVKFRGEDGVLKWTARGGRMSGDINTALGNCILSAAMLLQYADNVGIRVKCVVDGDDCVVFMDRADEAVFRAGLDAWYRSLGFRMKVENTAYTLEQVEFCQSKMVYTGTSWMLVRNPLKAITQDHCWIEVGGQTWTQVLGATGFGGLAMYGDMPVLCSYYSMLMRCSPKPDLKFLDRRTWLRHLTDEQIARRVTPSAQTRVSFAAAFGIPIWLQCALEEFYDSFDLKRVADAYSWQSITVSHFTSFFEASEALLKYY